MGGVLLLHGLTDSPIQPPRLGREPEQARLLGARFEIARPRDRAFGTADRHLGRHGRGGAPRHEAPRSQDRGSAGSHRGLLGRRPSGSRLCAQRTGRPTTPAPASLVLISPAIAVSRAAALAKWMDRLAMFPGLEALAWTQILPEFDPYKYNSFTSNAGYQVHRLTRSVKTRIEARAASDPIRGFPPTLVFLSTVDATVSAGGRGR